MTDQRDPILERVFVAADQDATDETFTVQVMSGIDAMARWAFLGRLAVGLALTVAAALFAPALQSAVGALNETLRAPLFDLAANPPYRLFSPLNSAASLLVVAVIGLALSIRTFFTWLLA
jgi:hypothetical protein